VPTRGWLSRIDEASGLLLVGVAIVAGAAVVLGLLACAVLVFAGVVHALIPYWAYVLAAFGVLVVLPLTASAVRNSARKSRSGPRRRPSSPPFSGTSGWDAPPRRHSATSIDWHASTSYSCRRCGHNWTSHGRGQGTCSVEGPPYTTETTVGWEGDIIQTESGTPCGCSRYEGIEPS
jgi:hypothetical protein